MTGRAWRRDVVTPVICVNCTIRFACCIEHTHWAHQLTSDVTHALLT